MNGNDIRARFRKRREIRVGRCDHQMHVEDFLRVRADRLHDGGPERDVRYEVTVHYIDVNPVGACLIGGAHFFAKLREVSRENGWRNQKGTSRHF